MTEDSSLQLKLLIKSFPNACFLVHARRRVELVLLVPPGIELPPLVLRLQDITCQGEVDRLVAVSHVELVSAIALPPGGLSEADVLLVRLLTLHHGRLVLDLGVEARGAVRGAVDRPTSVQFSGSGLGRQCLERIRSSFAHFCSENIT